MTNTIYQFAATLNNGKEINFKDYKGKVLLFVNTASKCGFTPQYTGLQQLYTEFKQHGFEVLGFPCDQFGHQEPGNNTEIQQFCTLNFKVDFPLFNKVEVNGTNTAPIYKFLKQQAPGILGSQRIKWNFTKFLVDQQGKVVKRYAPTTKPEQIAGDIKLLFAR